MTIIDILTAVKNTAGSNAKKEIINANSSNPVLAMIFADTYTTKKYFVHKYNKDLPCGTNTLDSNYLDFHNVLDKLANREVTGNAAIELLESTISKFDKPSQEVLGMIINHNLKIGLSATSFNKVTNTKVDKFEVALALNLDKVNGIDPIDGTYFISRKLDGVRCVCFVNKTYDELLGKVNYDIRFVSRQNKEFTTLSNLIEPIKRLMIDVDFGEWVLDGEVCIMDDAGNESFNGIMKEVTRKNHTIENPKYNVFDLLSKDEFDGVQTSPIFSKRLEFMRSLPCQIQVHILDQERVTSEEVLNKWTGYAKNNGWEGCMLRKDAAYVRGRSKDLLKIKKFQDAEYVVENVEIGKVVYNEGGMKEYDVVRAIIINHKGAQVRVGSGLSKEQRIEWYKDPSQIIGKTVTVQYFEETKNQMNDLLSLRFPVLKYVYEDGRNV